MEESSRKPSDHKIAVYDADGGMQIVEADQIRVCVPTAKCIQFWATFFACLVAIGVGIFFAVYQGPTSAYFDIGIGLIAVGFGVLIPGPNYQAILPKKLSKTE